MLTHLLEDERSINQQLVEMGMLIIRSASGSLQIGWSGDRLMQPVVFFSMDHSISRSPDSYAALSSMRSRWCGSPVPVKSVSPVTAAMASPCTWKNLDSLSSENRITLGMLEIRPDIPKSIRPCVSKLIASVTPPG